MRQKELPRGFSAFIIRPRGRFMERKYNIGRIIGWAVMIVLTLILLPILVMNIILIAKGSSGSLVPPDIGGVAPLNVTSGSMEGDREGSFPQGSLIFVDILSDEEKLSLAVDDVVTYYIEEQDGATYVTHRIISVNYNSSGEPVSFITRGDANDSPDPDPVPLSNVVGQYQSCIPVVGYIVGWLQNPVVIGFVVGVPVVAFIAYDVIRITLYNRRLNEQTANDKALADKDEEIARLRAMLGERSASQAQPAPADFEPAEAVQESAPAEEVEPEEVTEEDKEVETAEAPAEEPVEPEDNQE